MKTLYTVGHPDRDSSFISYDTPDQAMDFWRAHIEHSSSTNRMHGSVVKKHTFETGCEAETARLNFLLTPAGLAEFSLFAMQMDCNSMAWREQARAAIDSKRKAPQPTVVQIWPKPAAP